jgi:hypothetical protein
LVSGFCFFSNYLPLAGAHIVSPALQQFWGLLPYIEITNISSLDSDLLKTDCRQGGELGRHIYRGDLRAFPSFLVCSPVGVVKTSVCPRRACRTQLRKMTGRHIYLYTYLGGWSAWFPSQTPTSGCHSQSYTTAHSFTQTASQVPIFPAKEDNLTRVPSSQLSWGEWLKFTNQRSLEQCLLILSFTNLLCQL